MNGANIDTERLISIKRNNFVFDYTKTRVRWTDLCVGIARENRITREVIFRFKTVDIICFN